jgi:hypothetical protein
MMRARKQKPQDQPSETTTAPLMARGCEKCGLGESHRAPWRTIFPFL